MGWTTPLAESPTKGPFPRSSHVLHLIFFHFEEDGKTEEEGAKLPPALSPP